MALAMASDKLYSEQVKDIINNNQNLQNDIAVFDYAATPSPMP